MRLAARLLLLLLALLLLPACGGGTPSGGDSAANADASADSNAPETPPKDPREAIRRQLKQQPEAGDDDARAVVTYEALGAEVEKSEAGAVVALQLPEDATDGALVHLQGLPNLRELGLANTKVTNAGIERVAACKRLRSLDLSGTGVTDEGLAHLADVTSLRKLVLRDVAVSDEGLAQLKGLTGLEQLGLQSTRLSDEGLQHLAGMKNLKHLDLSWNAISDDGLVHLKGLTALESLNLTYTDVTDAQLMALADLANLKSLVLAETDVTAEGTKLLQQALPDTVIGAVAAEPPLEPETPSGPAPVGRAPQKGETAPEIEGEDIDGVSFTLSDYRGKVVVLNFWAFWCGPCRALHPHEKELVARTKGKPFALLGINLDRDLTNLRTRVEDEGITWRSWWDGEDNRISRAWNVLGIPTIYVLDGEGVIRYTNVRGPALDAAVDELLAELEAEE